MKNITCVVCPNGCLLQIDETSHQILGNKCPRGINFAIDELTNPHRSFTSSVRTILPEYPVISVRTDGDIPKGKIMDLVALLKKLIIKEYLPIGTIIVHNVFGSTINVITTNNMQKGDSRV